MARTTKPVSLIVLTIVSYLALVAAVCIAVTHVVNLVAVFDSLVNSNGDNLDNVWFFLGINLYGLGFALLVALTEIRSDYVFDHTPVNHWGIRGLFYIFVALNSFATGAAADTSTFSSDFDKVWNVISDVVSYLTFGIGLFYVLGEVLCLRSREQHLKSEYMSNNGKLGSHLV